MTITNKVKFGAPVVILVVAFATIVFAVAGNKTMDFDAQWTKVIYDLRSPFLTQILTAISTVSSTMFTGLLTAIMILAFWIKKRRQTALFFAATLLTSVIINNLVKYTVQRPRPEFPDMPALEDASWYSFPSGHSMNSLVFYGVLLFLANKSVKNKKLLWTINIIAPIFVLLVGFSRVYLGAHYPADVIAGFLAGAAVLNGAIAIGTRRGDSM